MNQRVPSYEHRECAHFYAATGLCSQPRRHAAVSSTASSSSASHLKPLLSDVQSSSAAPAAKPGSAGSLEAILTEKITARASTPAISPGSLSRLRSLVSVGIKVVTKLRNHVHFVIHTIHQRYPGIRIIIADDEYVGVGAEEWRRMQELIADYNATCAVHGRAVL